MKFINLAIASSSCYLLVNTVIPTVLAIAVKNVCCGTYLKLHFTV